MRHSTAPQSHNNIMPLPIFRRLTPSPYFERDADNKLQLRCWLKKPELGDSNCIRDPALPLSLRTHVNNLSSPRLGSAFFFSCEPSPSLLNLANLSPQCMHHTIYSLAARDVHNPDLSRPAPPSKMSLSTILLLICGEDSDVSVGLTWTKFLGEKKKGKGGGNRGALTNRGPSSDMSLAPIIFIHVWISPCNTEG